jgi:hypothetical protein
MRFKTNFEHSDPSDFSPIPEGKYEAEIVEASPEVSSNGKPYLNVDLRIVGPPHVGRHIWIKLFRTDAAVWKLAAFFNAIGEPLIALHPFSFLEPVFLIPHLDEFRSLASSS